MEENNQQELFERIQALAAQIEETAEVRGELAPSDPVLLLPWILLSVLLLLAGGLIWFFVWKKRRGAAQKEEVPPPYFRALGELRRAELSLENESAADTLKLLSGALRGYLSAFSPGSKAHTTQELRAGALKDALPGELVAEAIKLLESCDSYRFQGKTPSLDELRDLLKRSQQLCDELRRVETEASP